MDFLKRAWLYLTRKKGRTALLTLVTTAIMTFVLSGLLIQNAAITSSQNAQKSAGTTVVLSANRQAMFNQNNSSSSSSSSTTENNGRPSFNMNQTIIDVSTAEKIADLSNVSGYQMTSSATVTPDGFDLVTSSTSNQNNFGPQQDTSKAAISGVSTTAADSNFKNENYVITSGRGIKTSDENTNNVVIETHLAEQNDLKVGSTIKVLDSNSESQTLTVVGIYEAKSTSAQAGPGATDPTNTIYSSYTLASSLSGNDGKVSNVTYTLTDSSKENSFVKAATKDIDTDTLQLTTSSQMYEMLNQPMKNVESFASKIVWVVAIAGTAILGLILMLLIRERAHEIGVLLALGESKIKIVGQFFAELFMVVLASMAISGVIGGFIGNSLGQTLINQQTTQRQTLGAGAGAPGGQGGPGQMQTQQSDSTSSSTNTTRPTGGMGGRFGTLITGNSELNKLSTHVDAKTIFTLGGFGIGITALATALGAIPIFRLKPKKILTNE
ncbi:MAG: ABC transporter permease [Lactobacillaceae bacterium]|jgi:putative ABC transport system permease protein|nr:ABC transporter permease [Lactobacillaceae bacterium]